MNILPPPENCCKSATAKLIILITLVYILSLSPLLLFSGFSCDFSDFIDQQIPFLVETKRMFASGMPFWSWNTHMGENFIASYSYYTITSPFAWITILFPREMVLVGIIVALWLKCLTLGYVAFRYLKRMGIDANYSILGGLLYCFCSFFIINLRYYSFCEPMMIFPLLLIAIENVLSRHRNCYAILALASFGVVWINFYFAVPTFLCALIYAMFRIVHLNKCREMNEKVLPCIVKSFGAVSLGIMLSAVILVPTYLHLAGGPREKFYFWGHSKDNIYGLILIYTDYLRTFISPYVAEMWPETFVLSGPDSRSLFVQVFGIFAAILYVVNNRKSWLTALIGLLFIIYLTPLNGIFTGFTSPTYCRWGYVFVLVIVLASLYHLQLNKVTKKHFWVYVAAVTIFMIGELAMLTIINRGLSLNLREKLELTLFVLNLILLGIFVYSKQNLKCLITVTCVASVANFGSSVYLNLLSGDINNSDDANLQQYVISNELEYNDEPFTYRADYRSSLINIGLLKNRPGVRSFHSILDKEQSDYYKIIERTNDSRYAIINCVCSRVSHDILLSTKEYYDYREVKLEYEQDVDTSAIALVDSLKGYSKYEFKYYVPMGFCFDSYISRSEYDALYEKLEDPVKPMLINLVVEDADINELRTLLKHGKAENADTLSFEPIVAKLRRHTATKFAGDTHGFSATTDLDSTRVMFFSVSPDPGFTATIDGGPTKIFRANVGFSAIVVPKGYHEIRFEYRPYGLLVGAVCSLIALVVLLLLFYLSSLHRTPKAMEIV